MQRKDFLKTTLWTLGLSSVAHTLLAKENDELQLPEHHLQHNDFQQVGFEHLPNSSSSIMETTPSNVILHRADTRGFADHGWLKSYHTFSFANYYHPERVHFGALRVLNDDSVAGGMGFGTHPHQNMEIVSIPLSGDLAHKDSTGRAEVIRQGDIQIMSAGTGIQHSEFNYHEDKAVQFLQIWVLPKEKNIAPRYDQKTFSLTDRHNKLQTIVSPTDKEAIWINQDAYFSLGQLDKDFKTSYSLKNAKHGVYVFVISGEVTVQDQKLNKRDGMGIWDVATLNIQANSDAEVLLMEIPMT